MKSFIASFLLILVCSMAIEAQTGLSRSDGSIGITLNYNDDASKDEFKYIVLYRKWEQK